uniref:Uncharacterized protein n=1 Tax=Oryzias latipes TaxID=8090 RepID=A0A3B3IBD2_ORYLA
LVRRKLSLHHKEDCSVQRFLQGAEDMGLQTYDQLVIQNAADIARESDRLRSQGRSTNICFVFLCIYYFRMVEKSGKVNEGHANTGCRLIRHFRSSSGPTPLAMDNMVHFTASPPIKPALQQVVTQSSDDGAGSINLSSPRKQPPPKPKRDPNTRLSASYEAVSAGLTLAAKETSKPRPHSDDYTTMRKVPPPKPKRSPNTKLTGSYEEINAVASQLHQLRPADNHDEEDIYIEMMGSQPRARSLQEPPDSPDMADSEAVYEEMKYLPALTLGLVGLGTSPQRTETKRTVVGGTSLGDVAQNTSNAGTSKSQSGKEGNCEIPAPFPNLLPHRPPLLVFPPSPVTCSPASDESPLTPLEVKKLPVFETSLNYATGPDSPLALPPPYRPPSHFPFPPEASFLAQNRAASIPSCSDSPKTSSQRPCGEPLGKPPPYSPVKASRPEPRRAHSCSSSPLLFNPANGRPLTSPLDELNTLFSSGRSLLRKSTSGRKSRDGGLFGKTLIHNKTVTPSCKTHPNAPCCLFVSLLKMALLHMLCLASPIVCFALLILLPGFNSNINLPGREECGSAPTSPSLLQDKNANNHSLHSPSPITIENGNQISNGNNPPLHNLLVVSICLDF